MSVLDDFLSEVGTLGQLDPTARDVIDQLASARAAQIAAETPPAPAPAPEPTPVPTETESPEEEAAEEAAEAPEAPAPTTGATL